MNKWKIFGGCVLWMALVFAVSLVAAELGTNSVPPSVTLMWDHSPDTNVNAYQVYYGTNSTNYAYKKMVPYTNSAKIDGLQQGSMYYFVCTALVTNTNPLYNDESDYSNQVAYRVPLDPPPIPDPTNAPTAVKDFVILNIK
jgi:hypothetical protein